MRASPRDTGAQRLRPIRRASSGVVGRCAQRCQATSERRLRLHLRGARGRRRSQTPPLDSNEIAAVAHVRRPPESHKCIKVASQRSHREHTDTRTKSGRCFFLFLFFSNDAVFCCLVRGAKVSARFLAASIEGRAPTPPTAPPRAHPNYHAARGRPRGGTIPQGKRTTKEREECGVFCRAGLGSRRRLSGWT